MCSIFGYTAKDIPTAILVEEFAKSKERGPDMTRMEETPSGVLGYHRLAIMGLDETGMQPFALGEDRLVCNGEIYGFRPLREALAEQYEFHSESDCEILLPLWREHGPEMFRMLDAEFALLLYDAASDRLIAARDPIGIRPLFYGYSESGHILFSSEARCLVGLAARVSPFPPGCWYDGERFHRYRDMTEVETSVSDDLDTICANIRSLLIQGIVKRLDADAPVGFLLSGGLDSSLVCAVAASVSEKPIRTFAIGMREDAIDLKYARQTAEYLGSEHTEVVVSPEDILAAVEPVIARLGTWDITTVRASIGMYLVCRYIHEHTDIRVLLTGEISDELFGYKYTDFAPSAEAFQQEAEKRLRELHMYDVLRADRCIADNALEARVPFGDLAFVSYVMSIDPARKLNTYEKGKYLLRRAFEGPWLPLDILYREKAAFSDAVGHSMVDHLKARAESRYTTAEFERRRRRFTHGTPFTKESLLYREIFEKYYPGQGEMITDFWMPNRAWEGCDVDDPSARVLSNYGASGK